jgi:predicted CopG family antitoxin
MDFIDLITRIMKLDKDKKGTDSFSGVIVQKVDENGKIETIDI